MGAYDKPCADCQQEGMDEERHNTASVEESLARGREEADLIMEVVGHLRSRLGDAYTAELGVSVEQCLIHVLYWRNKRKEEAAV